MANNSGIKLDIGVVGAGINGMCTAWVLAQEGHKVTVYERDRPMSATSSASSKLLHGGLRYLENFEFRLVKEALNERDAWFERAPQLAKPLHFLIPVYSNSLRARWQYSIGLKIYDLLAKSRYVPWSRWHDRDSVLLSKPGLNPAGLKGAYSFWDGQMDDLALGNWVSNEAIKEGVQLESGVEIVEVTPQGLVKSNLGKTFQHDYVINVSGPWAEKLAKKSGINLRHELDLVRGSHIVIRDECHQAWLLEVPGERRIFFVLPWQGKTLVGTTEVRQTLDQPLHCSDEEVDYLIQAYRHYFPQACIEIESTFAGLRPLVKSASDPTKATREYVIEQQDKITTVLGGKWTTAMALARKIKEKVLH
jgi:glycerol-3-phosphate dehydrogenase